MRKIALLAGLGVILMGASGCTSTQKGMAAGSAAGAGIGAAYGTYVSAAGAATGALAGAGAGGLGGAIAAEYLYGEDEKSIEEATKLQAQLQSEQARARGLEDRVGELQRQKKALLVELERTRDALNDRPVAEGASPAPKATVDRESMALVVPLKSDVLFAPGKANLSSAGKRELHSVVRKIQEKFSDATIEVHGHTDSQPIRHSNYKSNWHLSTARACSVVTYLIENEGFSKKRLRPVGFADTAPVASNKTADGRARNRRAEIVVRPSRGK